jgi:hemoglobin-like flavoprotein
MKDILSKDEIEILQSTFKKIEDTDCWEKLYNKFFTLAPEAKELFKGDIKDQQHRIMTMVKTICEGLNNPQIIIPAIQQMGMRHFEYGVQNGHYNLFRDALMDAIKDTLGKEYTPQVEAAWNKLYSVMSENMMDMKF